MNTDTLTERFTAEMFEQMWNPARPLAGDTKGAAYRMSRTDALQKRFIQTHPNLARKMIVLDIDDSEAEYHLLGLIFDLELLPEPNLITYNPLNGHAQCVYIIRSSVGTTKGINFFTDVAYGLSKRASADLNYTGMKMRNPTHPLQSTNYMRAEPYTLKELASFAEKKPAHWYKPKNAVEENGSRHLSLFNSLRQWAYIEWRKPNFEVNILVEAQRINSEFDKELPLSSLNSIVRSIESFISSEFSEEKFSEIQSFRANLRWDGQGDRTNAEYLAMVEAGFTTKEIAGALGKSYDAARKGIQRAKNAAKA